MQLHLSIDNWRPDVLTPHADGTLRTWRMLPPSTQVEYFFSSDIDPTVVAVDQPQGMCGSCGFPLSLVNFVVVPSAEVCRIADNKDRIYVPRCNWAYPDTRERRQVREGSDGRAHTDWSLCSSIFIQRPLVAESNTFSNTPQLYDMTCEAEWIRLRSKTGLMRLIKKVGGEDEAKNLRKALRQHVVILHRLFDYLGALAIGNEDDLTLPFEQFMQARLANHRRGLACPVCHLQHIIRRFHLNMMPNSLHAGPYR